MIITLNHQSDEPLRLPDLAAFTQSGEGRAPSEKAKLRGAADAASLGTNAKSSSASAKQAKNLSRAIRYEAQAQAREWMYQVGKDEGIEYPGNTYRVCACRHVTHGDVSIMRSLEHGSCFYKGLVTCGSPWACSPCASIIQERRRDEIAQAIDWAEAQGLVVLLVTFTFPHTRFDNLESLILNQRDAFKRLRSGRAWMKLKPSGLIRSLEVTHGENGWHPHTHELWFCHPDNVPSRWDVTRLWKSACIRSGLLDESNCSKVGAFNERSVDIKHNATCSDYLAKQDDVRSWGLADEVAKAKSKAGKRSGVHPHHFLIRRATGDKALFVEYVKAMKGARQLFWSPGLKDRVGLNDIDDATLAIESEDSAICLSMLSLDDWKLIRNNSAHAKALEAAENGGKTALQALLTALRP